MDFTEKEALLQTSQPQKTKNLEIKVKKPGDLGEIWRFIDGIKKN